MYYNTTLRAETNVHDCPLDGIQLSGGMFSAARSGGLLGFYTLRQGLLKDERIRAPYNGSDRMF